MSVIDDLREAHAALRSIRGIARASDSLVADEPEPRSSFTDKCALSQIYHLADNLLQGASVDVAAPTPAVALADPSPQSSVTLTQGAKGDTRCEVKVYAHDPHIAMTTARELYDEAVHSYADRARVTEKEAVPA